MLEKDILKKVINFFETNEIEYMLTGSYVSSLQGQPRSTHDIDIILSIQEIQAELIE